MKKLLIVTFAIILGIIAYIVYDQNDLNKTKEHALNEPFIFEYGEEIILEDDTYTLSYNLENEDIGTQTLLVSFPYRKRILQKEVTLHIEDTTPPEFTKFKDSYELYENETITDIEKNYEAQDLSDVTLTVDMDDVNFKKEGTYTGRVIAKDTSNNQTEKEFSVKVKKKPAPKPKPTPAQSQAPASTPDVPSDTKAFYVDGHVIVNKKHPLPPNFASGEDPTAARQVRALISEMRNEGLRVDTSYAGFRTHEHQERLYTNYVKNHGQAAADISSAKPGYSEHQTGLTFDLRSPSYALLQTEPEITWLKENAHRFGFVVRYPEGKTHITGYKHEPWHLRYMGSDASKIYESGLTLEEYYNVEG